MANPCEHCKKYAGGCSWTDLDEKTGRTKFEPVKGWKAKPTRKVSNGQIIHSYDIKYCPEFVSDGTENKKVMTRPYKYDMARFRGLLLAGMTDFEIQRRMGGMPLFTIAEYKKRVWAEQ